VPARAVMHDWWCYLLATGTTGASLHFDPAPSLLYRQHGANALGAGPTGLAALLARARRFGGAGSRMRSQQLDEFNALYGPVLTTQASALLNQLLAARQALLPRLGAALTAPLQRQRFLSTLTTRFAVLTNRF
jgi:hypothetical protein